MIICDQECGVPVSRPEAIEISGRILFDAERDRIETYGADYEEVRIIPMICKKCTYPCCSICQIPGAQAKLNFETDEQLKYMTREAAFDTAQFNCMEQRTDRCWGKDE